MIIGPIGKCITAYFFNSTGLNSAVLTALLAFGRGASATAQQHPAKPNHPREGFKNNYAAQVAKSPAELLPWWRKAWLIAVCGHDMMNALESTSTRPYLIRALYDWCTDNGLTPYVAVLVDESVQVPREYVKNGEIVLNISFDATSSLSLATTSSSSRPASRAAPARFWCR